MANLIYAISEHRMAFGGGFAFDAVEGFFVYFDQFDIHDISVEIVREVSLRYCGCHSGLWLDLNAP